MSIVKVAKMANVSVATVSRFINRSGYVSEDASQRITESMTRIGYTPGARRCGPKTEARKGVVSGNVLFLSIGRFSPLELLQLPLFPLMIGHIMEELSEKGFNFMLAHSPDGKKVPPNMSTFKVDGVLIFGRADKLQGRLKKLLLKTSAVWIFREHSDRENLFDHVLYDNRKVGLLAAQHFRDKNIKNAVFLSPVKGEHTFLMERRQGFADACREFDIDMNIMEPEGEPTKPMQAQFLEKAMGEIIGKHTEVKGIFVPIDDVLLQVYRILDRQRLLKNYELIGCNNDPMYMDYMSPKPTTIDISLEGIIHRAVEQLIFRIRNPLDKSRLELFIAPSLVPGK